MATDGGIVNYFTHVVQTYWYGTNVTVSISKKSAPVGLVKVNTQGISAVNPSIFEDHLAVQSIHDLVRYDHGFAALCNTSHYYNLKDVTADLVLLDNSFNVVQVVQSNEALEQEKITSGSSGILFSAVRKSTTLQLITIKNGSQVTKDFTNLAQFTIESYKATPTHGGGWAILAWVWQTPAGRDLLFMELDENLNLVKN